MTDKFLKVNKSLFSIGLAPIEILIIAQVLEYQTKNMDCFVSNETFAKDYNVSQSTVSRAITTLKNKGFLNSVEKRTRQGTTRYLTVNIGKIEEVSTKQNADSIEDSTCQFAKSALSNLTNSTKQNDLVKDNVKDNNIKDNEKTDAPKEGRSRLEADKAVMKDCNSSGGFKF